MYNGPVKKLKSTPSKIHYLPTPALLRCMFIVSQKARPGAFGFYDPAEISRAYFQAIRQTSIPFSVVPLGFARVTGDSRWYDDRGYISAPLAKRYINVVCATGDGFSKVRTYGVPNIAILGAWPLYRTSEERADIMKYDAVIVPTEEYRQLLLEKCHLELPPAAVVPPAPGPLIALFKRFRKALREPAPPDPVKMAADEEARARAFHDEYMKDAGDGDAVAAGLLAHDAPMSNYPKKDDPA